MSTILKFEDLEIWRQARMLSFEVFKAAQKPPFSSDFRFRDQIKAAGSAMDNIAEGFECSSRLGFAKGSCSEVKSQLYRALDQNYISNDLFNEMYEGYTKKLFKLPDTVAHSADARRFFAENRSAAICGILNLPKISGKGCFNILSVKV